MAAMAARGLGDGRLRRRSALAALIAGAIGCGHATALDPSLGSRIASSRAEVAREPENRVAWFFLALRCTRANDAACAVDAFERLDALGWDIRPDSDLFASLRGDARFARVAARIRARAPQPVMGSVAFTLPPVVTEGIAYDPAGDAFFVGDLPRRAVLRVTRDGRAHDFVSPEAGGLLAPLGLKVDSRSRLLWVAANDEARGHGGVFAFDAETGAPRRFAASPKDGAKHVLNDLAIDARGDVFVTDSEGGGVYVLATSATELAPFVSREVAAQPNGIALSDDGSLLFVADRTEVLAVDRKTMRVSRLAHDPRVTLGAIDGLSCAGRALFAVQGDFGVPRVSRFDLDESFSTVERATVLVAGDPRVTTPTTGALANDGFYVIANSQIDKVDDDNRVARGAKLDPLVILRLGR
jgi:sugar lactone lactonase YvrE